MHQKCIENSDINDLSYGEKEVSCTNKRIPFHTLHRYTRSCVYYYPTIGEFESVRTIKIKRIQWTNTAQSIRNGFVHGGTHSPCGSKTVGGSKPLTI